MLRVACLVALTFASARAAAETCSSESIALHEHLVTASRNAQRWNVGWSIAFGGLAGAQLGLALAHDRPLGTFDRDYQEMLWVNVAKSTISFASRLVMPLRVDVPPCSDPIALRAALERVAKAERRQFWIGHAGAIFLNLAGALVLAERRSWTVGVTSLAVGYPVGLLSVYTMPRASWHLWRDATWVVTPTSGGGALGLAGTF
jgi:hypothetical protein